MTRSSLTARARKAALLAAIGGFALAGAAAPASATYYSYSIGGNFGNNTGPNQKGTFAGVARWDSSLNGGRGAWFEWTFDFFNSTGTKLQTLKHTDSGAGCFASPLDKGNFAAGEYASSTPGGSVCVGDNVDADTAGTYPDQTFLSIFNNVPYAWTAAGNSNTANYSYFRLKFIANGPGGTVDSGNLEAVDANAQSAAGLGWAAMSELPSEPCTAYNTFPTLDGNCPYAGNTQNYQGISGVTKVTVVTTYEGETPDPDPLNPPEPPPVEAEVPGPLPILGASAAFGWSRRLRRRLRARS